MKNFIYAALFSMICNYSFGQKCKEISDPITNEKSIVFENIGTTIYHYLKYEVKNGHATMTKEFYYPGALKATAKAGTEVFFKLENDEILKLKTKKDVTSTIYVFSTGFNFVFEISKEELNKLAASPVILIRVPKISEDGFYDIDKKNLLLKNSSKGMKKGAACIISYL